MKKIKGRPRIDPNMKKKHRLVAILDRKTYVDFVNYCVDRKLSVNEVLNRFIKTVIQIKTFCDWRVAQVGEPCLI